MARTWLNFAAAVDAWTKKSVERMEFVFKEATNYTFDEVYDNTPKDTGFLAQSFGGSTEAMPAIDPNAKGFDEYVLRVQPYELAINGAKLGDTIYGGFVAVYARVREYKGRGSGFVRLAAQNWQQNVQRAIKKARQAAR